MPEEGQDLEALEQALAAPPWVAPGPEARERVEALRQLAELERQSREGAPQEAVLPEPLAEQAPGLAGSPDPVVFGPVAARPVVNPLAALERALEQAGQHQAEAVLRRAVALGQAQEPVADPALLAEMRAALRQGRAGPPQAESRQAGWASHQPGVPGQEWEAPVPGAPARALAAAADREAEPVGSHPVAADLYQRQAELGRALAQEAALLRQGAEALVARLSATLPDLAVLPDLVALARLAGVDPALAELDPRAVPDLPEAERQAALHRAVARRLAVLHPRAGQKRLAELTDRVAARLSRPVEG